MVPPPTLHPYALLAVFGLVAVAFPLIMLTLARAWARCFQPPRPGAVKNAVYECGLPPNGDARIQFRAHYYLYAILFLIFDVEVVFLLPIAAAFSSLQRGALVTVAVFLFLLVEGLVWAWHRGHLDWT